MVLYTFKDFFYELRGLNFLDLLDKWNKRTFWYRKIKSWSGADQTWCRNTKLQKYKQALSVIHGFVTSLVEPLQQTTLNLVQYEVFYIRAAGF